MHQSVFYVSVFYVSLKFAPPVQGTPFTLGNLPAGSSEKLKPSAGYYRASGLCIPFQKLPGMTSPTPQNNPNPASKAAVSSARALPARSAGTKLRGSSRPISSSHCLYRVNRKHQEIQNIHTARGGGDRIQLGFLAGTEKTLLSSEGSTW